MGAPCINDTCSITSKVDPTTRRLEHHVVINPAGGLKTCDGPVGTGLAVEILGNPANAPAPDPGFQQLGITGVGELWSVPGRAKTTDFASAVVTIPTDATQSGGTGGIPAGTVTNPFGSTALAMIFGRFQIGWTIDGVDEAQSLSSDSNIGWVPYAAEIVSRMKVDNVNVDAAYHSISGVWLTGKQPHNGRDWRGFAYAALIGPGDTWDLAASGAMILPSGPAGYPYNLDFNAAAGFPDRGFQVTGQTIVFPFGVQ